MIDNQVLDQVQDAVDGSFVNHMPGWMRPYLQLSRMDRPVGSWLLFLPAFYGAIIFGINTSISYMLTFILVSGIGALSMRGAGCTWNDFVDRDLDAQVERTKSRPLPSKRVTPKSALLWMFAQLFVAALMLFFISQKSALFAVSSLIVVMIYPFAKRFTHWPQMILGLAMNWGMIVASVQFYGNFGWAEFFIYMLLFFWTLFYDTIYAFQDIEDDAIVGIKSSAQAVGKHAYTYLYTFLILQALCLVAFFILSDNSSANWISLGFGYLIISSVILLQKTNLDDRASTLFSFRNNVNNGLRAAIIMIIIHLIIRLVT